jgi:hypothetical protein
MNFNFFCFKAPEGESQPNVEVDLFVSTEKIMVLNTDLQVCFIFENSCLISSSPYSNRSQKHEFD